MLIPVPDVGVEVDGEVLEGVAPVPVAEALTLDTIEDTLESWDETTDKADEASDLTEETIIRAWREIGHTNR